MQSKEGFTVQFATDGRTQVRGWSHFFTQLDICPQTAYNQFFQEFSNKAYFQGSKISLIYTLGEDGYIHKFPDKRTWDDTNTDFFQQGVTYYIVGDKRPKHPKKDVDFPILIDFTPGEIAKVLNQDIGEG